MAIDSDWLILFATVLFACGLARAAEPVVEKAMRHSKRDRYATAAAMAQDMVHFLQNEPLQAEPVGARPSGILSKVKGLFRKNP